MALAERIRYATTLWLVFLLVAALGTPAAARAQADRDYLTSSEADKIRDAESANERVKLFLEFGADRLRRFENELHLTHPGPRRADFLNDLLDSFSACIDDADGRIQDAMDSGEDVRDGVKLMRKRAPELIAELKKIKAEGIALNLYQQTLNDAIEGLQDALGDAEKAQKELRQARPKTKPHSEERR